MRTQANVSPNASQNLHRGAGVSLASREEFAQAFVDALPAAAFVADARNRILFCNHTYAEIRKSTQAELLGGVWTEHLSPELRPAVEAENRAVVEEQRVITRDHVVGGSECDTCWLTHRFPVHIGGEVMLAGVCFDVSTIKLAERRLTAAIEEKQRLMDELNHRVKNNLAMVDSLIRLKDDALGDTADLTDIANQVRAIGAIHDRLQQDGDVTKIDVEPYVRELLATAFSFFAGPQVAISCGIDPMHMPTKTATLLGLIVNELATNAMKHGFSATPEPEFRLTLIRDDADLVLTAYNNGAPFPDELDVNAPGSLGLQLVSAIVAQLHGTLALSRAPHPQFAIRFPDPD